MKALSIPDVLAEVAVLVKPHFGKGRPADYIPQLANVPGTKFGMAVRTVDGGEHVIGDADEGFSVQSITKVFALGLALVGGFSSQKAPLAAGAFFLAFVFAIGSTLVRGVELPSCGCVGGGIKLTPAQALGVDSFLICLSYCAYRWHGAYAPIDAWIAKGKA